MGSPAGSWRARSSEMRTQILALGALCLLLITLSLVRFVWIATAAERTLILTLLVLTGLWGLWKKK